MSKLIDAFRDLDEDLVLSVIDEEIAKGTDPIALVEECNSGLQEVGELFGTGTYFLTDLMYSVDIMGQAMEKIKPLMTSLGVESKGKVIIGTVKGDIHDVGKNIVIDLLRCYGFEVVDAGIDVPVEKFVELIKANPEVKVLGLSALLNTTYPQMKEVIDALKAEGLKDKVKVIIGGTICSEMVKDFTGADEYATIALKGVEYCNQIYAS